MALLIIFLLFIVLQVVAAAWLIRRFVWRGLLAAVVATVVLYGGLHWACAARDAVGATSFGVVIGVVLLLFELPYCMVVSRRAARSQMDPHLQVMVLGITFFVLGLSALGGATYLFFDVKAFERTAQTAPGRVVDLELSKSSGRRSGGGYITVFTFTDAAGATHTGRTTSAQRPATHTVGEAVVVLYQPGAPETARIRGFRTLWLPTTICAVFGLVFSTVGAFAFHAARKTYRAKLAR